MIPGIGYLSNPDLTSDFETKAQTSLTYKIQIKDENIVGQCDGLDAVRQAVYKTLFTERYQHAIYSWNYGMELSDLFGKPIAVAADALPKRITDALLQDDRITGVKDFKFTPSPSAFGRGTALLAEFTVISTEGDFRAERVVRL